MNIYKILISVIIPITVASCMTTGGNSISQSNSTNTASIDDFPILDMDSAIINSNNIRIYTHTVDRVDGYSVVPTVTSYDKPDHIFFSMGYYADPILVHNPDVYYWGQFGVPIRNELSTTFAIRKKTKAVHLLYNPTTNSSFVDPDRLLPVITTTIAIKDEIHRGDNKDTSSSDGVSPKSKSLFLSKKQPPDIKVYASLYPSMIFQVKKEKGFFAGVESITYFVLVANTPLTLLDIVKEQYRDEIIKTTDYMQLERLLRQMDTKNKHYQIASEQYNKTKKRYFELSADGGSANKSACDTSTPEWLLRCSGDDLIKLAAGVFVGFGKGLVGTAETISGQSANPESHARQEAGGNALYSAIGTNKNKVGAAENTGKVLGALYALSSFANDYRPQESNANQSNANDKSLPNRSIENAQPETKANRVVSITLLEKLATGELNYKYPLYQVRCQNKKTTDIFFDNKSDCMKEVRFHLMPCSAFYRKTRTIEDAAKEFCADNM